MSSLISLWPVVLIGLTILTGLFTVNQGTIAVITRFGRYVGIRRPGLRLKIPFIDQVYKRVSIQNRSVELEFQAVTVDQANVYFKSMLLYSVQNEHLSAIGI
jgi:regulator of protease activity HflC (stomatin/prohibitin superfamily)